MQTPLVERPPRGPPRKPRPVSETLDGQVSLTKCLIHRKTTILGRPLKNSKFCDCCGMRYQKQVLDVLFEPKNTFYLGSGLASYFLFIKLCVFVVLAAAIIFSLPNTVTNLLGKQCEDSGNIVKCVSTRYINLSVANKLGDQPWLQLQSYLTVATVAVLIGILQYSRKAFKQLQIQANSLPNESDYAVIFRLKLDDYTEEDIKQGVQEWWERHKRRPMLHPALTYEQFPIEKVVFSYKVSEYNTLEEQRQTIKSEQLKYRRKFRTGEKKAQLVEQQDKLKQIEDTIASRRFPKNNKCIVLFRYPEQKQYILEQHQRTIANVLFGCCFNFVKVKGKLVSIKQAALPSQINWHNHEIDSKRKHICRLVVKIVCFLLIAVAEGVIFGLLYLTFQKSKTGIDQLDQYISPVLSLSIGIINLVLYRLLTFVSRYEYRATTLQDKVSVTSKVVISIFLNSGVMLLFAYFIIDINSVWVANGFIDTMTFSYLLVTFMPHVLSYANVDFLVKFIQRTKLKCSSRKLQDVAQVAANKVYERPEIEIYEKYAWMINLMWWTSIFAPIIPISYICALASLLIHFWNEKLMYVGLMREPKPFGNYLNSEMLSIVEVTPFFLAAGNIGLNLILLGIRKQPLEVGTLLIDIIGVGISLLLFLIPSSVRNKLIQKLCCIKTDQEHPGDTYQQVKNKFITTYEKENPVYRELAISKLQSDRLVRMNTSPSEQPSVASSRIVEGFRQPAYTSVPLISQR